MYLISAANFFSRRDIFSVPDHGSEYVRGAGAGQDSTLDERYANPMLLRLCNTILELGLPCVQQSDKSLKV